MHQLLRRHPGSDCPADLHIEVEAGRPRDNSLMLSYIVTGTMSEIRIPPVIATARSDELWRHTCFEAFVRTVSGAEYYEFNFAPSTQWAAYRFSSYRRGRRVATEIGAPRIEVQSAFGCYRLQASLRLGGLSGLPRDVGWRLGLAAVTEDTNGRKSYWALAHPSGKADFHHFDCFAHELSAA